MHKKKINNSLTKNFIQGLRPLSNTLPTQIKKVLKKNGFNLSSIVDNWTKIIGNDISNKCYPINIKAQSNSKDVTLILNVIHGKEIDIEYNKKKIIDKINTYFGYSFIKNIHVKIRVYLEYPVVYLVPGWVPVPGSVSVAPGIIDIMPTIMTRLRPSAMSATMPKAL